MSNVKSITGGKKEETLEEKYADELKEMDEETFVAQETVKRVATVHWLFYTKLTEMGFTPDQAMVLVGRAPESSE